MCLGGIRQVIQPDEKLAKMMAFAKIILIINVVISIMRIFLNSVGDMIYDLICSLFLMMASFSIYFLYMAMYQIFCLINSFIIFIKIALVIQIIIQIGSSGSNEIVYLSLSIFIFTFYVFAIIFTYPMYKEMRAQAMESFGGSMYRSVNRSDNIPSNNDQERVNRGFVPFSGRGVAIG